MSQQLPGAQQAGGPAEGGQAQVQTVNVGAEPVAVAGNGPGGGHVGVVGIVGLITYLVIFTLLLIYGLVKVWPVPTPSREPTPETTAAAASPSPSPMVSPAAAQASPSGVRSPAPTPSPQTAASAGQPSASPKPAASPAASPLPEPVAIGFFGFQFRLWDEQRLLLLVLLAGALGSILHDLRSVYWYVGNRSLVRSWMAMYIVLPFAGATLALIFYLVVRGGFFSPQSSFKETSPFGFAAFAALIGMFSPQAVLKLREVAETLLTKPAQGANAKPQEAVHPPNVPAKVPPAAEKPPANQTKE
jgi:hypothetical protein